ncbi:MAG TPA: hypothetical protein PKK78_22310, partial [Kouleothrix sp.]|nr:hypothetical protein [Kouleothrix sp.]
GAQDLVGNVFEWTASPWEHWQRWEKDFTDSNPIAVSWSWFGSDTNELSCGARDWFNPNDWYYNSSFRVVQSRALG